MKKNEKGFSVVEGLLILVIIGIVGFIGWYVWRSKSNTSKSSSASGTNSSQLSTNKTKTPEKQEAVDPYAGWKTYCDTSTDGCFRYPSDWDDLHPLNPDVKAFGQNKAASLNLEYLEPVKGQDGLGNFLTKSILATSSNNAKLKVVGGYYTAGNIPGYSLADTSLIQQLGLAESKTSNIGNGSGLYFTKNSNKAVFIVHFNNTTGNPGISTSQANTWFDSVDGKLASQIAQSFYFK